MQKVSHKILRQLDSAQCRRLSGLEAVMGGTGDGDRERSATNTILESEAGSETRFGLINLTTRWSPSIQPTSSEVKTTLSESMHACFILSRAELRSRRNRDLVGEPEGSKDGVQTVKDSPAGALFRWKEGRQAGTVDDDGMSRDLTIEAGAVDENGVSQDLTIVVGTGAADDNSMSQDLTIIVGAGATDDNGVSQDLTIVLRAGAADNSVSRDVIMASILSKSDGTAPRIIRCRRSFLDKRSDVDEIFAPAVSCLKHCEEEGTGVEMDGEAEGEASSTLEPSKGTCD